MANNSNGAALPKTYKTAVIPGPGKDLAIEERELKAPAAGEVLVKVLASGVCHSDEGVRAGHFGPMVQYPRVPGHETIGEVVAVGDQVSKWKIGDRVGGAWHGGHCHFCQSCRRGMFQCCQQAVINGVTRDGGYAEYTTIREEAAVSVPKDVDPVQYAPILCAGVTVFNSLRKLNIAHGQLVAVQGIGGLGHLAIQFARNMGYKVVCLSSGSAKEKQAKELGAHYFVDRSKENEVEALNKLGGAACIMATAPNPDAISPLTGGLQVGGHLLVLAPVGDIKVNSLHLITKAASVSGYPSGHALDSEEAIEFCASHQVKCQVESFPLDKVNDALEHMRSGKVRFRAVLKMA